MAAFDHVRKLTEVHDHLTATELKPGFMVDGEAKTPGALEQNRYWEADHAGSTRGTCCDGCNIDCGYLVWM
jgi:hypothetical protein